MEWSRRLKACSLGSARRNASADRNRASETVLASPTANLDMTRMRETMRVTI
jgi:hypothetical protein